MSQSTSIADEVAKLVKLKENGKISEPEFLRMRQDLIERHTPHLKRSIAELLNELRRQSYYVIPNMEDDFRLEVALKLLNMIEVVHMDSAEKQFKLYNEAEKLGQGIHILYAHFYSVLPILSQLPQDTWTKRHDAGLDWNERLGLSLLAELSKYYNEYEYILESGKFDDSGQYGWLDAALYYCIIRHFNPKNIIEVGAGDSTRLATLAASNNGVNLTSIDPFAAESIDKVTRVIRKPVQEIQISEFKTLQRNDILFIDSTHVCKIGSDVNYLFLDVLPNLNPGVLIHIHDIFLPLEFPKEWVMELHRFWNEQYLLHAFLISNRDFEILFGIGYMLLHHRDFLLKIYGSKRLGGGSFWIRKIK